MKGGRAAQLDAEAHAYPEADPDALELNLGPIAPPPPKPPKAVSHDKTVKQISTKKLIEWLQKADPSGRLQVHVDFSDSIQLCKPTRGERGSWDILAELSFEN